MTDAMDKENIRRRYLHNRHGFKNIKAPHPMKMAVEPEYTERDIKRIRKVATTGIDHVKIGDGVFERVSARVVIRPIAQPDLIRV